MFPRLYCINLARSKERRGRMERRFQRAGLTDVVYVTAVEGSSTLVDYYDRDVQPDYNDLEKWRASVACFISHLRALRLFLEDNLPEALITEDDILLCNDFRAKLLQARGFAGNTPLLSLSYMLESTAGMTSVGHGLFRFSHQYTWGAQLYLITRDWAMICLNLFDRPFRFLRVPSLHNGQELLPATYPITSENIIRVANDPLTPEMIQKLGYPRQNAGLLVIPPLAIEEGVDSDRAPGDLPFHHNHFRRWGYTNYSEYEDPGTPSPFVSPQ